MAEVSSPVLVNPANAKKKKKKASASREIQTRIVSANLILLHTDILQVMADLPGTGGGGVDWVTANKNNTNERK